MKSHGSLVLQALPAHLRQQCTQVQAGNAKHVYFAQHFELTQEDPILVTSPVGHAVSLLFGVRMCLMLNSLMVLIPRWNIEVAAETR